VLSGDESEMYFMGIIDILQFFGLRKQIEFVLKTRVLMRDSVCVNQKKKRKEKKNVKKFGKLY
jgi:hypothetical protein